MRVLITGGRSYPNRAHVYRVLDEINARDSITELIHGACKYGGADILGEDWAKAREIDYVGRPARWVTDGKAAGFIRNQRMIDECAPDLVVAFPGGNGTADMVRRATKANLSLIDERRYE